MSLPELWEDIQVVFHKDMMLSFEDLLSLLKKLGYIPDHLKHKSNDEIILELRDDYYALLEEE